MDRPLHSAHAQSRPLCVTMATASILHSHACNMALEDQRPIVASDGQHETNATLSHHGDVDEIKGDALSLQEAFLQFRKTKQDELRERLVLEQQAAIQRKDPLHMQRLRKKFLDTALEYVGVPYAQRYHPPESPTHHAELFLDCCGLVRRVVRDLKEEFGFTIGPWNQAYQFDTLPIALSGSAEMKPGDLVFISATYYNPKAKKQRHDIVHVEIWVGDGEKTLGARWQKGVVEIHDSYKFVSKSYHSMKFHFRSIDTWLAGECQSHCEEHSWIQRSFNPEKRSVFALEEEELCDAYSQQGEKEEVKGETPSMVTEIGNSTVICLDQPVATCSEQPTATCPENATGSASKENGMACTGQTTVRHSEQACGDSKQSGVTATPPTKATAAGKVISTKGTSSRTVVICGGNAAPLVEQCLTAKGWVKLEDKLSHNFTLKWVELKQHIDYKNFREGEQMVNRIPNIQLLTTKIGLLESLRSYCKLHRQKLDNFLPETFRMDVATERKEFFQTFQEGELWICKPTGANQGKGIFLVRELQQLLDRLEADERSSKPATRPTARIVQRYIRNPLLLRGRKFDIRVYMLVVAGSPWMVLYRKGYVRLCCEAYQLSSPNLGVHLTNQYQQKKNPLYQQVKEDTVWDFGKFQECLSEEHGLPNDWVHTTLTRRFISIMTTCFNSVKHKLNHALGYFDLLGFDFMLDSQLNVWLIEVNVNPALHTNCTTLASISPAVVQETLAISIEVFGKCRRNRSPLPISALNYFRLILPKS